VDASEDPDVADQWGVFSVPTLFVLDAEGQPRSVFNGVVGLEKLKQELQAG
jgi:thioredoxin-like negative regulator of GroEL